MAIQSFETEFLNEHPTKVFILKPMREALGKSAVDWQDLTTLNLSRIREHFLSQVSPNTAFWYFAVLKAFLARYSDEGIIPCKNPAAQLKAKKVPSQHIALTEEEIERFDKYEPQTDCERDAKILFMRGCYTGARSSDCKLFTPDIIRGDHIAYVSVKTKTEVVQPLHRKLVKYLEVQPSKPHQANALNAAIQRICKAIGITEEVQLYVGGRLQKGPKWKFVGMHSSRRSYCSNLALRGAPVEVIAKLAGHRNSTLTSSTYIVVDTKRLNDVTMAFFNG